MVLICGAGFGVMDYLYTPIDYNSPAFKRYMSRARGDGGISPGHLCFEEALEKYAKKPLKTIRGEQGWDREPDKENVGGPCIVAQINAAQLTHNHGVKVRYYGAMGMDATADHFINITKQTPVDMAKLKKHEGGTSPYAICLSDPKYNNGHGERSFVVNIGVYQTVPVEKIIDDSFFEGDILFYGATALTPSIHNKLTSFLRHGSDMGKVNVVATVFDHISEAKFPGKRWAMGDSDDSYKYIDLLMVDWDEALSLSGEKDIDKAIAFFKKVGVKALIVTHGPDPLYAYSDGSLFKKMHTRTFPVCKAIMDELRADPSKHGDSTGCGDNFSGGVLAYMGEGLKNGIKKGQLDLTQAIAWGCASGGFTCFIIGGTFIEKHPGEKRELIDKYRRKYLSQLADAKL